MTQIDFNAKRYLDENPDVADAVQKGLITAWEHFRTAGQKEGRAAYDSSGMPVQADLIADQTGPKPAAPAPKDFNEAAYLKANPDVADAVQKGMITAYGHWESSGRKEGRTGAYAVDPSFDAAYYLKTNPDVAAAVKRGETTAEEHYILAGKAEKRSASAPAAPPPKPLRDDVLQAIAQQADHVDSGLTAGGLADTLSRQVITPWRASLQQLRDGKIDANAGQRAMDELVKVRDGILAKADAKEFTEAIRYAGSINPGFLSAVVNAGSAALQRQNAAGTAATTGLSASDQATKDMMAAVDAAADKERVRSRRGRGATLLTGLAGLQSDAASVARRLLTGG
ncbi:hypothetical protein AZL_025480 [Azospirillum sp. B510]|uniref:hypothetical protein n=1 Tax=Azospirillum sp. (strain B510) TaxID=137722 RepID=UPI0001C4CBF2|nr:hypothetical protein [Azospirillum sp. B510]BAI73186.1 hypothetical protein AZL_025480 [Azospirillum sp. B510]